MKGIYIEVPEEDIENLDRLSKGKTSRVSIIRNLLLALRGMDKDCSVIVFDKENVKIIEALKEPVDVQAEYSSYQITISYCDKKVAKTGFKIKPLGGDL